MIEFSHQPSNYRHLDEEDNNMYERLCRKSQYNNESASRCRKTEDINGRMGRTDHSAIYVLAIDYAEETSSGDIEDHGDLFVGRQRQEWSGGSLRIDDDTRRS
jgi:hypothetical protein